MSIPLVSPPTLLPSLLALLLASLSAPAQEAPREDPAPRYAAAAATVEADLRASLRDLEEVRRRIATERPPAALEARQIAADLREKRRLAGLASQSTESLLYDLNKKDGEIRSWREEQSYLRGLFEDYRKQFEAQVSLPEWELLRAQNPASSTPGASFPEMLTLLDAAFQRFETALGGQTLPGQVVDPDGVALAGTFIQAGPVAWFAASASPAGGLVLTRPGLLSAVAPGTGDASSLTPLLQGQEARPLLDPTLGTALALRQASPGLAAHIREGGFWIYPILLLALVATIAAIYKWCQILSIREFSPSLIRDILAALQSGAPGLARQHLASLRHPARALLERGIEVASQPPDVVEEAIYEKFLEAQPRLHRGLPFIAIASATAPLLGLLGTVTGMIHTFELINIFGTGDARSLASGISEALVTTEFGLIVAIPALILHALLSRKIKGIIASLEMTSLAFLNGLKSPRHA